MVKTKYQEESQVALRITFIWVQQDIMLMKKSFFPFGIDSIITRVYLFYSINASTDTLFYRANWIDEIVVLLIALLSFLLFLLIGWRQTERVHSCAVSKSCRSVIGPVALKIHFIHSLCSPITETVCFLQPLLNTLQKFSCVIWIGWNIGSW